MKKVIKLFDGIAIGIFVLMVLTVLFQIASRFVFKISAPWTEELNRLLFLYVGFMGTAIATREKEHIVVDMVLVRLPKSLRKVFDLIIQIIMIVFFYIMLVGAVKMFMTTKSTYYQSMPFLSNGWMYIAVVIGSGASLISLLIDLAHSVFRRKTDNA